VLFSVFFRSLFDDALDGAYRIRCLGQQVSIGRRSLSSRSILAFLLFEMIEQRLSWAALAATAPGSGEPGEGSVAGVRESAVCEPSVAGCCASEAGASTAALCVGAAGVPAVAWGTSELLTAAGEGAEAADPWSPWALAGPSGAWSPAPANDVSAVGAAPFPPPALRSAAAALISLASAASARADAVLNCCRA
jgi:hypothetical protein